jgi:hypothetical protein
VRTLEGLARAVNGKRDRAAAALICFVGLARTLTATALGFRPFDDTYITFRYALNIGTGHGFVYNWGQRVLGTTTPLWTLILAPTAWLGLSPGEFAIFASSLFDIATALLVYCLVRRLRYTPVIGAAASILFLLIVDYFALTLSGMESSLFVLFVVGVLLCTVDRHWFLSGVLGGFAVLTRPEGIALCVPVLAAIGLGVGAKEKLRCVGRASSGALFVLMPWLVFATLYFGSPIPQSILAKYHWGQSSLLRHFSNQNLLQFAIHGQFGGGLLSRTYWQGQFILTLMALIGAGSIVLDALHGDRTAQLASCVLMTYPAAYVSAMAAAAAFTWFPWYYAPLYPFLAVLAPVGASAAGALIGWGEKAGDRTAVSVAAILVLCQLLAFIRVKLPAARNDSWTEGWSELALQVPHFADVSVGADEIGVLGWTAYPATVIDLVGLVSPGAWEHSSEMYLRAKRPDYVALRVADSRQLLDSLAKTNWFATEYRLKSEILGGSYVLYERVGGAPASERDASVMCPSVARKFSSGARPRIL